MALTQRDRITRFLNDKCNIIPKILINLLHLIWTFLLDFSPLLHNTIYKDTKYC